MSEVNTFSVKGSRENPSCCCHQGKITPLTKKKLLSTEEVTKIEEVDKGTNKLDDKKEAVVMAPFSEKQLLTTEKVTTSEEVDKVTKYLDDKKEAVVLTPFPEKHY